TLPRPPVSQQRRLPVHAPSRSARLRSRALRQRSEHRRHPALSLDLAARAPAFNGAGAAHHSSSSESEPAGGALLVSLSASATATASTPSSMERSMVSRLA